MPLIAAAWAQAAGALRENENVGGSGHDCDMRKPWITGAGIRPALGPWLLSEAPLADVASQVRLR